MRIKRSGRALGTVALAVAAAMSGGRAHGGLTVMQVEGNTGVASQYAPVKFSGGTVKPAKGDYAGVTFTGLAGRGNTFSAHALQVAGDFYGPGTVGKRYVSSVLCDSTDGLLARIKAQGAISPSGPRPGDLPAGVSVINGSFIAGLGSPSADGDAARRLDYVLARSQATYVASAVVNTTDRAGNNLFWSCRNVIAVRGSSQNAPFEPSAGDLDRNHCDLWDIGDASYATARVSSAAAALAGEAAKLKTPDAASPLVVKSLLLTGADRSATDGIIQPWTRDTGNAMDVDAGAGRLSYANSRKVLRGGQARGAAVVKGRIAASAKVFSVAAGGSGGGGWSLLSGLAAGSRTAVPFSVAGPMAGLTVTLDWMTQFRVGGAGGGFNSTASGEFVPAMALSLVTLKKDAKGYGLGSTIATSDVRGDNLERLLVDQVLAAGRYAIVVSNNSGVTVSAGLSFLQGPQPVAQPGGQITLQPDTSTGPLPPVHYGVGVVVPEPGCGLMAGLACGGLVRRRQR